MVLDCAPFELSLNPLFSVRLRFFLLAGAVMASSVGAADAPRTTMQQMQGVYKARFPNGTIDGRERWISEDIVEIVPMDPSHIYFRAELAFSNGHRCGVSGAATYQQGGFVYRDPKYDTAFQQRCVLQLHLTGTDLVLNDADPQSGHSTCQQYCGMRGSLRDYRIARSKRRTIRYLPRLKASPQYQQALQQIAEPSLP